MAVLKCKMCGGTLDVKEGMTVCECEYCGSLQTVPQLDDEKKLNLFARANRLRRACEFDKASGVYETIVADFPEEAEAYWGLLLCKYGIEYVDDPKTGKKIPTCHRSSFNSIMDDQDFDMVMECSDPTSRAVYREEAKAIEALRIGINEVSSKEEPYDIFICYKETDAMGERTIDSVIAQDVYDALVEKGYRVFFSRISLEDKLGQEYEPYIFAALNSAKVMLAFGTDYENYNAVWVKNEWSRFLSLIEKGEKKTLIPCFKGLDAYDMPKEFARLQAQDMGKVGAIQDLLRGIGKIIGIEETSSINNNIGIPIDPSNSTVSSLIKRMKLLLIDGEWGQATENAEKVLDIVPENAEAYLGQWMSQERIRTINAIKEKNFHDNPLEKPKNSLKNYFKYADENNAREIRKAIEDNLFRKKENAYNQAIEALQIADSRQGFWEAEQAFKKLDGFKDSADQIKKIELARKNYYSELEEARKRVNRRRGVLASDGYTSLGVLANGSVSAIGSNKFGQCNVAKWTEITAVTLSSSLAFGLRKDGIVEQTKIPISKTIPILGFKMKLGQEWNNIVAVSAGSVYVAGLRSDGKVVLAGSVKQIGVSYWEGIIAIDVGINHTVGLRKDGKVVAEGANDNEQTMVSRLNPRFGDGDIVAIAAGAYHTVGLRNDGTVVATGASSHGQCDVSSWRGIVGIAAGAYHTVGLKKDGTVITTKCVNSEQDYGQYEVNEWTNIEAVYATKFNTFGIDSDGNVVSTIFKGRIEDDFGQFKTSEWNLFKHE